MRNRTTEALGRHYFPPVLGSPDQHEYAEGRGDFARYLQSAGQAHTLQSLEKKEHVYSLEAAM
jgi:hypothetical protein